MSPKTVSSIKLATLLLSAGLLAFGLSMRDELCAIAGAVVYISVEIVSLVCIYRAAKLYRVENSVRHEPQETPEPNDKHDVIEHLARWLRGLILFAGLFLLIMGKENNGYGYAVLGIIIWGGSIVGWFLSGFILREVGGMPLRMGYGGWHFHIPRNRRHR